MIKVVYFSPTGNSKHLASKLASELNTEDIKELKDAETEYELDDHIVLMFPIHGFNPPRTIKRYIKELKEINRVKISLLAIGCNELWLNDAVNSSIRKQLVKKGYEIVVDEILAMPLTLVMDMPEDVKEKTVQSAEEKIKMITQLIQKEEVSSRRVKLKSKLVSTVGKLEDPAARLFGLELHANKKCVSCGICWDNCPENNIKKGKNEKPKFGFSCSMCLRCIYDCPEQAIKPYISRFIPIKNGYKLFKENEKEAN